MRLVYSVFDTTTILLLMIIVYVVTCVHIVTSDFRDIGHEKNPCRAALEYNL